MPTERKIPMTEHYVVEQTGPKWLITMLTSLGGVLMAALLLWIASSQLTLVTTTAVIQRDLQSQSEAIDNIHEQQKSALQRVNLNINQIWPRLRAHGENIEVLRQALESMCECKVKLAEPEKF